MLNKKESEIIETDINEDSILEIEEDNLDDSNNKIIKNKEKLNNNNFIFNNKNEINKEDSLLLSCDKITILKIKNNSNEYILKMKYSDTINTLKDRIEKILLYEIIML